MRDLRFMAIAFPVMLIAALVALTVMPVSSHDDPQGNQHDHPPVGSVCGTARDRDSGEAIIMRMVDENGDGHPDVCAPTTQTVRLRTDIPQDELVDRAKTGNNDSNAERQAIARSTLSDFISRFHRDLLYPTPQPTPTDPCANWPPTGRESCPSAPQQSISFLSGRVAVPAAPDSFSAWSSDHCSDRNSPSCRERYRDYVNDQNDRRREPLAHNRRCSSYGTLHHHDMPRGNSPVGGISSECPDEEWVHSPEERQYYVDNGYVISRQGIRPHYHDDAPEVGDPNYDRYNCQQYNCVHGGVPHTH